MALVTGDERIVAAHERAVGTAIGWIEEHAEPRRRMDGNIRNETTGQQPYARITEHASRELEPHLHTQVVNINMPRHVGEEQLASVDTSAMYVDQRTDGTIRTDETQPERK